MGVTYHKPMVGPKFYTARGTSGWVEAFPREVADQDLQKLLGQVPVKVAVDGFRTNMKLAQRKTIEWSQILEHLARLSGVRADLIPDSAGVALWCLVLLADKDGMN